jgi:hypothetical protein
VGSAERPTAVLQEGYPKFDCPYLAAPDLTQKLGFTPVLSTITSAYSHAMAKSFEIAKTSHSYISLVANGRRRNKKVRRALLAELEQIEKLK